MTKKYASYPPQVPQLAWHGATLYSPEEFAGIVPCFVDLEPSKFGCKACGYALTTSRDAKCDATNGRVRCCNPACEGF